jgi:hypothetical protein
MAYEGDELGTSHKSPSNPLKVQNLFLLVTAGVLLCTAFGLLLAVRSEPQNQRRLFDGTVVAMLIISLALALAAVALTHLKYLLGRSETKAPLDSGRLRKLLGQSELNHLDRSGPLNGVLYAWIDALADAPLWIQYVARVQFRNAATMAALLLSLVLIQTVGRVGVSEALWAGISSWTGCGFLLLATYLLVLKSPWRLDRRHLIRSNSGLTFLLTFGFVGPVFIALFSRQLPQQSWVSVFPGVYGVLVVALVIYALYFYALMGQLPAQPCKTVSATQDAWNIRCSPAQIMGELDRAVREGTVERAPNWNYIWKDPDIDLKVPSGRFSAEALVEMHIVPYSRESTELASVWADPNRRRIVLLDIAGAILTITGAWLLAFQVAVYESIWSLELYGVISVVLGSFAFMAAHRIWSRFEFDSRLLWMVLDGTYTSRSLRVGRAHRDVMETHSQMAQIESMTFRLCAGRLQSVMYGKHAERDMVQMMGDSELVQQLSERLYSFAQAHAVVAAPGSSADLERSAQLVAMNKADRHSQLSGPASAASAGKLVGVDASSRGRESGAADSPGQGMFCTGCGKAVEVGDAFCRHCGKPVKGGKTAAADSSSKTTNGGSPGVSI